MVNKTKTHIATIFKIEKLTLENETLLVLIPHEITIGELINGEFITTDKTFAKVLDAYEKGDKFCYSRELSLETIKQNGKKILTFQFGYDEDELTTANEIFDAYKIAYAEDLKTNVWYVDLEELAPYVSCCNEIDFYTLYGYSIDENGCLVNRKPHNVSDDDLAEVADTYSGVRSNQVEEITEKVAKDIKLPPTTRIKLIEHLKKCFLAQDEPIERIASAVYNPIKIGNSHLKRNIMIYGPTGVGKTEIVREIAKQLGLPFYRANLSEFSATGYEGSSVSSLYTGLYAAAGRDISLLEKGAILFLDEVDKLIISDKKDVKSQVYNELLTLLDPGGVVNFKTAHLGNNIAYDKSNLIIITAGSFGELTRKKKKEQFNKVGFKSQEEIEKKSVGKHSIEDLAKFGIPVEFLGRQHLIIDLNELSEDDLFQILMKALYSPYVVYKRELASLGITLNISESSLRLIAKKAYKLQTGARALATIFHEALEPEINAIVDKLDEGSITEITIDVNEEEMVKRLERYHGN